MTVVSTGSLFCQTFVKLGHNFIYSSGTHLAKSILQDIISSVLFLPSEWLALTLGATTACLCLDLIPLSTLRVKSSVKKEVTLLQTSPIDCQIPQCENNVLSLIYQTKVCYLPQAGTRDCWDWFPSHMFLCKSGYLPNTGLRNCINSQVRSCVHLS